MRYLIFVLLLLAACTSVPECADTEGSERVDCVIRVAAEREDAALCNSLESMHYNWCINEVAAATGDRSVCERLDAGRDFCLRDLFVADGDVEACGTLEVVSARDDCYEALAYEQDDYLICLNMAPSERRDDCIDRISRRTNDPLGCVRASVTYERRDPCIYVTSIRSGNADTCSLIIDPEMERYCYLMLGINAKNETSCENLPEEYQDFCRNQIAATNTTLPAIE